MDAKSNIIFLNAFMAFLEEDGCSKLKLTQKGVNDVLENLEWLIQDRSEWVEAYKEAEAQRESLIKDLDSLRGKYDNQVRCNSGLRGDVGRALRAYTETVDLDQELKKYRK